MLNVKSVGSGKTLMVNRGIFIHDGSFRRCQEQKYHNMYAGLNATCAQVTSIEEIKSRIYFCNLGILRTAGSIIVTVSGAW